ncbi:MAG TPA: Dabb family protein [Pseudomonadota bacterium]|nr:Dabb family protein [Pseudomonadota bacterium]
MFVHLVLIKLKPGIARDDARVRAWESAFEALPPHCSGIARFEHGWNTTNRPIAYDYGVNMAFATRADLDAYGPNPKHQQVVASLREFSDWIICDYEVAE